jgi:FixJ family two-component response regulator
VVVKTDAQPVVYVIDDEPEIRGLLAAFLLPEDYRVVGMSSVEELLEQKSPDGPGCLVLDVFLPGLSGLEAQEILVERFGHLPIVFISGQGSIPMSVQAMKAGAVDFLTKPFGGDELRPAVERAIGLSKQICTDRAERHEWDRRFAKLTDRELEVLRLVATGRLNKQIAAELDIVEKTVKVHRSRGMQKLGLRSVADLVRLADRFDSLN